MIGAIEIAIAIVNSTAELTPNSHWNCGQYAMQPTQNNDSKPNAVIAISLLTILHREWINDRRVTLIPDNFKIVRSDPGQNVVQGFDFRVDLQCWGREWLTVQLALF